MTYERILEKLERMRYLIDQTHKPDVMQPAEASKAWTECQILYGELEDVMDRFAGIRDVTLHEGPRVYHYRSFVEALMFHPYRHVQPQGYAELLKVIGKVRQQASDPGIPTRDPVVSDVVGIIARFRECCQYLAQPPQSEKEVQDILWIMLRARFDRLDREETLPKFGAKAYRPDFGVPDVGVLIEAKFIGETSRVSDIQEEILADIPGYLHENASYSGIAVLVYDKAQKLRDCRKFVEDVSKVPGIINVQVIPGIG